MQTQQTYTSDIQAPLVSFIVTTYNLPVEYIKECLDSILQLSLSDKEREIILVDDGSDICQLNELSEYLTHIIYLRQPNQGVSVARNYGMMMAKGRFIQFVDGDDYLIQSAYEHCLDIVRYHQPDIVTFKFSKDNSAEATYELPIPVSGTDTCQTIICVELSGHIFSDEALKVPWNSHQVSCMGRTRNSRHNCSYVPNASLKQMPRLTIIG